MSYRVEGDEDEFDGMNGCDYCREHAPAGKYYHCPKCDAEWHGDDDAEQLLDRDDMPNGEPW